MQNASPRRLGCAAVLRDVLENKVLGGSVTSTYIDKVVQLKTIKHKTTQPNTLRIQPALLINVFS
jgi:hypothetical protein